MATFEQILKNDLMDLAVDYMLFKLDWVIKINCGGSPVRAGELNFFKTILFFQYDVMIIFFEKELRNKFTFEENFIFFK